MTGAVVLRLTGDEGFRLTVGDDGDVHDWLDVALPPGEYDVSVSIEEGLVTSLRLYGPSLPGHVVTRRTTMDMGAGSVFCVADSRHRQPFLGPFLSHEAVVAELGADLVKVVTPAWLGTPVLLVGPTVESYQDLWRVAWRTGGRTPSKLALDPMRD